MNSKPIVACAAFVLACAGVFAAAVNYQLLKKITVPGTGGWDYVTVDDVARRVYISHSTQVDVLDADSFAHVGSIPNTPGAHGVAIDPVSGRGYITAGKVDSVIAFDSRTLKPLGEIKVGKKPDAIIYEPLSKRIYVMNGDSDSITVLNAADGAVVGTILLGGGPEFAVSDAQGNLYVNLEEQNETLHIDVNELKVKDRWPLAPCATPTSLAMDRENRRLFIGCRSKHFAVLNADNGKVIFTAPIGERVDAGAFDPKTRLVYLSTGDGKVFVFHQDSPDKYSQVQEITTKVGAKTMGFDAKTGNLFVPTNENGTMQVLVFTTAP
ncbi:MAG TPA: YncE family protein [Candidatus Sulfotelmatobacter sp.]|nr:YncE family protein [Candidatus Sulfotelmatobacter sp.]